MKPVLFIVVRWWWCDYFSRVVSGWESGSIVIGVDGDSSDNAEAVVTVSLVGVVALTIMMTMILKKSDLCQTQ